MQHIILLASLSGELLCRLGGRIWSQAKRSIHCIAAQQESLREREREREMEKTWRHGQWGRDGQECNGLEDINRVAGTRRDERGFYHCWAATVDLSPWHFSIKITSCKDSLSFAVTDIGSVMILFCQITKILYFGLIFVCVAIQTCLIFWRHCCIIRAYYTVL